MVLSPLQSLLCAAWTMLQNVPLFQGTRGLLALKFYRSFGLNNLLLLLLHNLLLLMACGVWFSFVAYSFYTSKTLRAHLLSSSVYVRARPHIRLILKGKCVGVAAI